MCPRLMSNVNSKCHMRTFHEAYSRWNTHFSERDVKLFLQKFAGSEHNSGEEKERAKSNEWFFCGLGQWRARARRRARTQSRPTAPWRRGGVCCDGWARVIYQLTHVVTTQSWSAWLLLASIVQRQRVKCHTRARTTCHTVTTRTPEFEHTQHAD